MSTGTGADHRKEPVVVTAVTTISAPMEAVWRVLVAFDQYARWHPVLSFDARPEQVVVGAEVPGRVSDGAGGEQDVTMRIVDVAAPRRLVWEGGSLDAVLGRHSFTLGQLLDGSTELTDSEEFFGATAAELVPALGRLGEEYARYGVALRARAEGRWSWSGGR
ncbi:SRPBCC domain-containing protein [Streptomyces sp. W16]|uniref:SRPBCC domain-containing protein n=1 Tax=Streptomyces sp. W16 TaxID=3076631 RepID=UPI00295B8BF0|nr:SRPBCC domain-containing protein [Streptomyces sp. W16]MDV9172096.1 SRPBCC domain-containing protein [Streptomyces sp. W16]